MRIAFWVRTGNKYGSLEKYIALFAEVCKEQGHAFLLLNEIANTSKDFCDRLENAGASQLIVGESLHSPIRVYRKIMPLIRHWQPDIMQLHFINSLALPFLKLNGVQLVYQTYHSSIDHDVSIQTRMLRQLDNKFATRVFAVSDQVRKDEVHAGVNPDHIEKSYLGLRIQDFDGQNLALKGQEPLGWNDPHYIKIITVGRFFPVKGMRYVVEAAVQVIEKRKDIIWWLVGKEGPESAICRQIIEKANLQDQIIMLGQRNDIPALLNQSKFQVVGSLSEGLGLMALEAAACGIPTIGTRIGGLDEAIVDGETGLLVDSRSAQSLADATIWMLDHPEQTLLMGMAAKKYVTEEFNSEEKISRMIQIFLDDYNEKKR
jgi:glycosyltransferase involved in cell wall biosynthesis